MRRTATLLATTVAVTTLLSGCFLLPSTPHRHNEPTPDLPVVAKVGDCWEVDYSDLYDWATWDGDGPVDCSDEHQSYTFVMPDLGEEFGNDWFTDDGGVAPEIALAGIDKCRAALKEDFGRPDEALLVQLYFFVPTVVEVKAGARWVRCDLAVTKIGSATSNPRVVDLPEDIEDLVAELDDNPEQFELCTDVPDDKLNDGPYADGSVYADCTDEVSWRQGVSASYPGGNEAEYPGDDAMTAFWMMTCGIKPADTDWYVFAPDADSWTQGHRDVECWTTDLDGSSEGGGLA
jgi:hypothetical protein